VRKQSQGITKFFLRKFVLHLHLQTDDYDTGSLIIIIIIINGQKFLDSVLSSRGNVSNTAEEEKVSSKRNKGFKTKERFKGDYQGTTQKK